MPSGTSLPNSWSSCSWASGSIGRTCSRASRSSCRKALCDGPAEQAGYTSSHNSTSASRKRRDVANSRSSCTRRNPSNSTLYVPSARRQWAMIRPKTGHRIQRRPAFVVLLPAGASAAMAISPSPAKASSNSSRYRGSKMCSGCMTCGNSTRFGNGNSRTFPDKFLGAKTADRRRPTCRIPFPLLIIGSRPGKGQFCS